MPCPVPDHRLLLETMPHNDPVYRFTGKKRAKGKPYMTARGNKLLRIYYRADQGVSGFAGRR
ncbi:hypothetical protein HMPREF0239_04002 [Clostridium sp. ATCC BAA-442]|nr:hypothetical protein HMPREF0239_04002 [Clostridium sp. ATCC BAA-442]